MPDVQHNGRTTDTSMTSLEDMEAMFAEAEAKDEELKGYWFSIGERRWEVWPGRFTHRQSVRCAEVTGMTFEAAMASRGVAPYESLTAILAMSVYQTSNQFPDLDKLRRWVMGLDFDAIEMDSGEVSHEEDVAADPLEPSAGN